MVASEQGAAVWADTGQAADTSTYSALIATADNNDAAYFANNSANDDTIYAENFNANGSNGNVAPVFAAAGKGGVCGMNGSGDVMCSGRVKTALAVGEGGRSVEVYAMQSPENWIEDFGSGELKGGRATVTLEPQFAAIANTGVEYHVFLTPHDADVLFVEASSAGSFTVRESKGGKSDIRFDYRIVAKRAGHEGERLADATEEMRGMRAPGVRFAKLREAAAGKTAPAPMRAHPRSFPVIDPHVPLGKG